MIRKNEDPDIFTPAILIMSDRGPAGEERTGPTFSPALFYAGERPERFEEGVCRDRGGVGGAGEMWRK